MTGRRLLPVVMPKKIDARCFVPPDCLFSRINSLFAGKDSLFLIAVSLFPLAAIRVAQLNDDAVVLAYDRGGARRGSVRISSGKTPNPKRPSAGGIARIFQFCSFVAEALEKAQNGNGRLLQKVGMDAASAPRPLGVGAQPFGN